MPFADALAEHSTILPPYYLGIIRTAELTGRLDVALEQLSGYIERDLEAKSKIKSALMYPAVVLAMSIVTITILMIFVLPKFVDFFNEPRRAAAAVDAHADVGRRTSRKNFWFVFPLGRARPGRSRSCGCSDAGRATKSATACCFGSRS